VTADVVIPTWRGREMLERCLRALAADPSAHCTIVVDNASHDGTAELVGHAFPDVRLVELSENAGFGRAVNAGARVGDGEAIVLVNNDVIVEPGFVRAITEPLRDPEVGMVAGLTLMPGCERVDGFGIELDGTLAAYNRLRGEPLARGELSRLRAPAIPSGGAAAYRRSAFEAAGGFDERLFAYGEDVDLGLRLRAAGWRTQAAPDARGVHLGGATIGVDSPAQRELAGFARGYLLRRYGVFRTRAAPRALLFELLVVGWGAARHHTLLPVRARVHGWRAARGAPRRIPEGAVDPAISAREAFERLRTRP
jgi:N-acetylglucosaminyl-diphospho-decaprenol L-rhamnosyltransferase